MDIPIQVVAFSVASWSGFSAFIIHLRRGAVRSVIHHLSDRAGPFAQMKPNAAKLIRQHFTLHTVADCSWL